MNRARAVGWVFAAVCALNGARADEFDRIEGPALFGVPKSGDAPARRSLTIAEIEGLPTVLRETRSALILVQTDQGNMARMLVAPALRKTPGAQGKPLPVIVLERFDTFESGGPATRLARGKDVILFDGFEFDLDSGQVVPKGQGGDLVFSVGEKTTPQLETVGKARLFTPARSPVPAAPSAGRPSLGRAVVPGDFSGRYRLFANGQWSGTLEIQVGDDRGVTGRFRSDLTGTSYPVTGEVAADVPQKITFTIKYPRARQEFEGRLWSEGKGAMAGTLTMLERTYGFFALRQGGRFAPEGEDVGPLAEAGEKPHRRTVTVLNGNYKLDGKPLTREELAEALRSAKKVEPATWVSIQASGDERYANVWQAIQAIAAAGVSEIRVAPLGSQAGDESSERER